MTTRDEQETTIAAGRDEANVYIYTTNPVHLRRLRKDDRSIEIEGGDDWGRFTVPTAQFDPLKGFRRQGRTLTPEQRAAAASRLAVARQARG